MNAHAKKLWQQMADLTMERCKTHCKTGLGSCCSGNENHCEMYLETMRNSGETPPAQARGEDGKCQIPPCYRPLCTLHQCDICAIGLAVDDPKWTERYYRLRSRLEKQQLRDFEKENP